MIQNLFFLFHIKDITEELSALPDVLLVITEAMNLVQSDFENIVARVQNDTTKSYISKPYIGKIFACFPTAEQFCRSNLKHCHDLVLYHNVAPV